MCSPSSSLESSMSGLEMLCEAAKFVDRTAWEQKRRAHEARESDHGYSSRSPMPEIFHRRKSKHSRKSQGNRSIHNELEKNRRANLRSYLDNLKVIVPIGNEANRHTTLGLLNKAKSFIKSLEESEKKSGMLKEKLFVEQRQLYRRLEQLGRDGYRCQPIRSISECSSVSTTSSLNSSESDDVDIMGSTSDSDDHESSSSYEDSYGGEGEVEGEAEEDMMMMIPGSSWSISPPNITSFSSPPPPPRGRYSCRRQYDATL